VGGATVDLEGVSFRYRTRAAPALREVDLSIAEGETILVLGPSGSGKSTLTLCLNGLIPHQVSGHLHGHVRIDGQDTRDIDQARLARSVGMVFQDPEAQFCMLKVADEVAFGLENLCVPRAHMPALVAGALAEVGLIGHEGTRIERLSGGQKQRLALASSLALQPRAIVFDEPTANLDAVAATTVFDRVRKLRGERTMVIVEHRVEHALPLADRVLILGQAGAPIALGRPEQVLRENWSVLDKAGVWLPEVAELALRLSDRVTRPLPLTVDDATTYFGAWRPSISAPNLRSTSGRPAVTVRGLSFTFPGGSPALRDVSCDIPEAALTAVVGPNGSGKTTFVSHLSGILAPPRGSVYVFDRDGRAVARRPEPTQIGFVFQNPEHQFLTRRARDEVAWGLRRLKLPEAEVNERVAAELAGVGLLHLADVNPYKLSGGEKRRLSLATALVLHPRLLVLDEPTFGQDRATSSALVQRLHELVDGGTTVVVVTHDMGLVASQADHVVLLIEGKVAYEGRPTGLFADTRLLQAGRLERPPLLRLARKLGMGDAPPLSLATVAGWLVPAEAAAGLAS
jgi:energy-coupling factor transport system ATP-binding protein